MKALQYLQVLLLIVAVAYLGWFHLLNPGAVAFPLPFAIPLPSSASVAVLIGFLFGVLYAALLFAPHLVRRSNQLRRQARRVRDLESEAAKLRPAETVPVIPDRKEGDATLEALRERGML